MGTGNIDPRARTKKAMYLTFVSNATKHGTKSAEWVVYYNTTLKEELFQFMPGSGLCRKFRATAAGPPFADGWPVAKYTKHRGTDWCPPGKWSKRHRCIHADRFAFGYTRIP
jgi:hypothetical protein